MAQAFDVYRADTSVVMFASGVSNSLETDPASFDRERKLLLETRRAHPEQLLVYFGTCSAEDPDRRDSPYVRHKIAMESLLESETGRWLVIRLPLAIGPGHRGPTLAKMLHDRISQGIHFEVWAHATRYPIDVADVVAITGRFLGNRRLWNRRINVALRAYKVREFVSHMETIVGRRANFTLVDRGAHYEVSCPELHSMLDELQLDTSESYLPKVLTRYFANVAA